MGKKMKVKKEKKGNKWVETKSNKKGGKKRKQKETQCKNTRNTTSL